MTAFFGIFSQIFLKRIGFRTLAERYSGLHSLDNEKSETEFSKNEQIHLLDLGFGFGMT